jgi:hypothetical protein
MSTRIVLPRLFIFLIAVIIHFLTPTWFLDDFLRLCEWDMLFCALFAAINYNRTKESYKLNCQSFFLSINTLVYFVTTTKVQETDIGNSYSISRLALIFKFPFQPSKRYTEIIEAMNAIQVLFSVILLVFIIIAMIKKRQVQINFTNG